MGDQQPNRISIMNFGEQLLGHDGNQFQMNNTWVPIAPEKLILVRSNTVSDWPANQNQMRRVNYQELPVPGSDYKKEMLLPYHAPDLNLHLIGQMGQNGEGNNYSGISVDRNSVINHIAGTYTQAQHYESNGLNNNTLELLLQRNATNIATANRSLDASINMAARNPLLPNFYPQASSDASDSYAGVQRCNGNSSSDIMYKEANRLLIPNRNSEFSGSNLDNFLNNDIHCSVPNQMKGIFSDIPHGDSYNKHNLNYVPIAEADATTSFTNSLRSIPETMDQLKFVETQLFMMPDYTIAESTSHENDLLSSSENEIQEYCDGLLQQIVDSSSAVISTTHGDQKGSASNICVKGSGKGFDLNKTPEQKAPKRRKHRPKVIVEAKPKRNPNPATQKTQIKETPHKKRSNVPKTAATPKADVIKETVDSTATTRKSCRKALNFDSEKSRYESQSRTVFQQEIHQGNVKAFDTTSDYQAEEMLLNSALLISQQDELTVQNQQPRNTDDIAILLNEKVTNPVLSERESTIASSASTEEQQIAKFLATEKGPAQGYFNLCQERYNAKEIGNTLFQSETCFDNSQKGFQEKIFQQLVPNILSNSTGAKGSKRKYSNSTENQHCPARNPLGTSLCQEILQVDGNFKGTALAKGSLQNNKRKRTQNRPHAKVCGRPSSQTMSKDNLQKVRIAGKKGFQSHHNEEMPNCCTESSKFVEQQNNGTSTGDCFDISGKPYQTHTTLMDNIICQLNGLSINEENTTETEGQKALVPYQGQKALVPYQEFELGKKQKPRPKVALDPETERTWNLLMGKEGCEDLEGADTERENRWEEERNIFRGRADSFIARMHLVQGDRRFSKWKGSVVDSVIGVFLTQNVSDHLSSSAFMSLAAKFPLKSKGSNRTYDVVKDTLVEEAEQCIVNPSDKLISYERGTLNQPTYYLGFETPHHTGELWRNNETSKINESLIKPNNQSSEEEFLSSQDSLDSTITQDTRIRSSSGSNSESRLSSGCESSKGQFLTSNSLQIGKTTVFQEFYHSVNGVSLFEEQPKDGKLRQVEHVKQSSRVGRNDSHSFHSASGHPQEQQLPVAPSKDYELHYSNTQGLNTSQMCGDEFSWPETVSAHGELQDNNYRRFCIREVGDNVDKSIEMQCGNGTQGSPELPTMNPYGPLSKHSVLLGDASQSRSHTNYNQPSHNHHLVCQKTLQSESRTYAESLDASRITGRGQDDAEKEYSHILKHAEESFDSEKIVSTATRHLCSDNGQAEPKAQKQVYYPGPKDKKSKLKVPKARTTKTETKKKHADDWDKLRKEVKQNGTRKERSKDTMDSMDYEALRCAPVKEISEAIIERGMNNMLAGRIKDFLTRLVKEHGSIDLEWLRQVPPDKVKDYLLSIQGLGLKSVECVRLLTLHHLAFPVDTNVGRIAVRLGWVPLQPLPETLQIHLLEMYPVLESVQKYLWPRLCKLDQRTLYELHYQMITFGKVFCTKKQPNCNACPMRAECRHFASAFASARLALPGPEEKHIVSVPVPIGAERNQSVNVNPLILTHTENNPDREESPQSGQCEPIIEEPATPEQHCTEVIVSDIEDYLVEEDPEDIPHIDIRGDVLVKTVHDSIPEYEGNLFKALAVALSSHSASIPAPKLKNVSRLRTEHQVYELPDSHPLLDKMDKREPDDPSPYLLAIWSPGETANSIEPPKSSCGSQDSTNLCNDKTCFSCNSIREANSQIVRGTLLIPCRTATRGSFPLNGTYFQVNELFADHASSVKPIDIPREWIWNLPRKTVYFGTSVSSIFKGLSTREIQHCFWRGFVCVRGFDQQMHAPRPLSLRFHLSTSRSAKTKK